MNTASLLLRLMLGASLAIVPFDAQAKPKKGGGGGKQRSAAAGRPKAAKAPQRKAPQRVVKRSAPRQQRVARAPAHRNTSKPARSKPRAAIAQQRRASSPGKRATAQASKSERRFDEGARHPRNEMRGKDSSNLAAIQEGPQANRNGRIPGKGNDKIQGPGPDRQKGNRGPRDARDLAGTNQGPRDLRRDAKNDRRDNRVETPQERDRRAQRVRERERLSPGRKQQIADRQERRRERVERFRENRQRRFAAVQRDRRAAFRAANFQARREYARQVREEIRDYWEDRADDIRDRIRDRYDDLYDDDWWDHHHHWYGGPILVSDPWWWWRPASWGSINLFINAGWSDPIDYDYGTDVIYDQDAVYVNGEPAGTPIEYNRRVVAIANPTVPAVAEAPVTEEDWRSLGVWALAQEQQGDAVMFFQLSVNREGIISGAYTNVMSGESLPVSGSVDRQTQRAAWHIGDAKERVFEAGMANLAQDQASCLVHVGDKETQNWLLVRLPDPKLPDAPKTLGQTSP